MALELQLVGIAYGLGMFYFLYASWRRHELTNGDFYIWSLAWFGFIFALIFPSAIDKIRSILHIGGGQIPFYTIFGFMFLTGIVFYLYQKVRSNSRKIEKIVRTIAIKRAK
jgi:hypothetical protein